MEEENSLNKFLDQYKLPLALGLVGVVLLIGGMFSSGIMSRTFSKQKPFSSQPNSPPPKIKIDVSGAVQTPGVYVLDPGARVEDALRAAGGISNQADPEKLSKTINLAQSLVDGMKIYIPSVDDPQGGVVAGISTGGSSMVNINSASLDELDKLPGVGSVTAQRVVDNRPYQRVEELLSKRVVSKAVFEKIKGLIGI